jgi:hypothetical protein
MREILPILIDSTPNLSGASAEVDLRYYFVSPGRRECKATLTPTPITTTNSDTWTVAYKLQESVTTVDTDFTDITNGSFSSVSDSDTVDVQAVNFSVLATSRYLRGYNTLTGTGVVPVVELFVVKREA